MKDKLNKVNELIENTNNIPTELKPIVKSICKGYIRESNNQIPLEGIINVCNTTFIKKEESDYSFRGEDNIFATTETNYDNNCNIIHKVSYVSTDDYIKLISILTHELGHVITESKPCDIITGIYPLAKRTTTIYNNCFYEDDKLVARNWYGFRMADGFLESISSKIFSSPEFREELKDSGYDLKDYVYKDERIFSSRIYDEYKACFELFDYIMDGKLTEFSCIKFSSNKEFADYINENKLINIFQILDKSNDAFSALKKYEGKESTKEFEELLENYEKHKNTAILLSYACLDLYNKKENDENYIKLKDAYSTILEKQKILPIKQEFLQNKHK